MPNEFTGERVIPGQVDADLLNEHLSRYAFARRFAAGRRALDLGCGSGYGAAVMAEVAEHVTAIDLSGEAIEYARSRYAAANLVFAVADATIPPAGHFGLITAFEVIEHLQDWRALLHAARDRIASEGIFLVSTPNRPLYAESRGTAGTNPFHIHEFEYGEFQNALAQVFPYVVMFTQNHSAGILFTNVEGGRSVAADLSPAPSDVEEAHFFLAVCALRPLPAFDHFFWLPSSANLLHERDGHIALLRNEVELKTQWMEQGRAELALRNQEFDALLRLQRDLKAELEERNRWALEQNHLLQARGERIGALQAEVEAIQQDFEQTAAAYESRVGELEETNRAKTEWALETERRLTVELTERTAQLSQYVELLASAEATVNERTIWAQSLDRELIQWQERFQTLRSSAWVRAGNKLRLVPDSR